MQFTALFMYVFFYDYTAIYTEQDLPILQLHKDDITKGEFNPKADEIKFKKNDNTYEDDKTSTEDCEPLLNLSQTSKEFTYETPDSQRHSDGGTDSEHPVWPPVTNADTVIKDHKRNEKEAKDKKDNYEDKKLNDEDGEDNDKDDRNHEEQKHHDITTKVEANIHMVDIMDAVKKLSRESNERKTITFLDFAGQSIYYAFHQIYLSPETFSILVVNMEKNPKNICEPNKNSDYEICCSRFESWTYEGNKI